eukprot:CAMPEP_0174346564 /NCGR_PEP_ID=MMETSP0811_2-20130205/2283_1 /TAXON_ID=73025 ORGANISM="Eutreptiella gymnastica-like, Strain CCMP1594" /NCGR_SAMPLE_ID=MMETSP0811_2 /ASSEMBLY_ACC=CAM_ASM_000667 /LENGTH=152 /DNA_ID=CAMNT_0015471223 /DNA_START=274 /DNA_END=735 /DNA_ORIENTATION=-
MARNVGTSGTQANQHLPLVTGQPARDFSWLTPSAKAQESDSGCQGSEIEPQAGHNNSTSGGKKAEDVSDERHRADLREEAERGGLQPEGASRLGRQGPALRLGLVHQPQAVRIESNAHFPENSLKTTNGDEGGAAKQEKAVGSNPSGAAEQP